MISVALALLAYFTLTGPANADPVSVGGLVITGLNTLLAAGGAGVIAAGATIAGFSVASLIGSTVLTAASIGASLLLSGRGKAGRQTVVDPTNSKQTFEIGNSGQLRVIGRGRVGGVVIFGNTLDYTRYRLMARAKGPIDAVEANYLGGREVIVEANGDVSSPPFVKNGGSYVNIRNKIGDGTETTWNEIATSFPTLWTQDHRVRGIAQSLVTYTSPGVQSSSYLKIYGSGYPDSAQDIRGELLYDPRDGMTRWSDNGVLAVLHILLNNFKFPLSMIDQPFVSASANSADALVGILGGGTEKRSRCWGVWEELSITDDDLLKQILISTGTVITLRAGDKLGIALVDDIPVSEATIKSEWIYKLALKSGPEAIDRPNTCKLKYYSPERNYELAEINLSSLAWANVASEVARYGVREQEFSLPFCPSASQAQRIARRLFGFARAETGAAVVNAAGLGLWGAQTAKLEAPELGETLLVELNSCRVNDSGNSTMSVEVPFIVIPSLTPWSASSDEAPAPFDVPELGFTPTIAKPLAATSAANIQYPSGGASLMRVGYSVPDGITAVEAAYNISVGGVIGQWQSMTESMQGDALILGQGSSGTLKTPKFYHANAASVAPGSVVLFRHRFFNALDEGSEWSPTFTTTPIINNSTLPAPVMAIFFTQDTPTTATVSIQYSAPPNINVVSITKSGAFTGVVNVEPGQTITNTQSVSGVPGQVFTWTTRAGTTNGALSLPTSVSYTIPL
jgi:hypothetical protein